MTAEAVLQMPVAASPRMAWCADCIAARGNPETLPVLRWLNAFPSKVVHLFQTLSLLRHRGPLRMKYSLAPTLPDRS